jgi:hypothetical protein
MSSLNIDDNARPLERKSSLHPETPPPPPHRSLTASSTKRIPTEETKKRHLPLRASASKDDLGTMLQYAMYHEGAFEPSQTPQAPPVTDLTTSVILKSGTEFSIPALILPAAGCNKTEEKRYKRRIKDKPFFSKTHSVCI